MSEENSRGRQNCCRLCLAPDNECISILNSYAADKEPLTTKIQNCVGIRITHNDRFSLRICHACISYLNSWQSFKNRCLTSQNKQRQWLDTGKGVLDNSTSASGSATGNGQTDAQHHNQNTNNNNNNNNDDYQQDQGNLSSSILDGISSLKKRKSLTVYPLPAVEIKDEPVDMDDEYMKHDESDDMVDPTLFLERTEEEGDEPLMDASCYDYNNDRAAMEMPAVNEVKEASCRACHLKFSTRANARRHERNLHPNLFELSASTPNNMLVTRPTPALAAALEMQRAAAVTAASGNGSLSTHKFRQEIVNAFNKCESGDFDYDNPEKYQHFLTDEKIVFLQQNEEFLEQYQSMTCRCCNRYYTTYKNFMAHMRKKYASLPRNLCFNCLKLNDSKALFISHLKRRNCINLYKILHSLMDKSSSFAAAVAATAAAAPEKLRAKELLVNKMYECKLCPQQFRLKLEFRSHVYEAHADAQKKDVSQTQCSYCAIKLEDPIERKRHYNNMDCIVRLRCVTCSSKFDNHQKFLDHVYEKHLAGFGEQKSTDVTDSSPGKKSSIGGATSADDSRSSQPPANRSQYFSRMPQACSICGQQYNNYNNVLRHMESKHPHQLPQTYKCVKCSVGYPRLSNLREHMVTMHAADKARHTGFEYIVNADAVKITDNTNTSNVYTGRYDYVMKDLLSITNGGAIDDDDENENPAKKMRKDNTSTPNSTNVYSSLKECPICNAVFSNNIGLSNHMRSHTAAAQNAAAMTTVKKTANSMAVTGSSAGGKASANAGGQGGYKRSFEQAADRRFRRMRCRLCQRRFSSKKSYRFHMLSDHQIRDVQFIKCKLCDAEFAYEKGLKVHMFKIHNTLLKDEMIIKQFECEICSIVYRTDAQLQQHKKTVHGIDGQGDADDAATGETGSMGGADQSGLSTPVSGVAERTGADTSIATGPLYWYQCKYCPSNFNTNKKLAIHINSHDEFDSKDYSCKDCGNVYSGRKSLWVHRYKKHPQIAQPSECVLCKKVFFDKQMLENHIPTCNRKPITATGAVAETATPIYKHKTGDDEDENSHEVDHENDSNVTGGAGGGNFKIQLPEVACTMCGQRFTDQELFSKHIQMHEMELYTDNPLAAMFDTGPADPNQFFLDRVNENGEYACDLCSKTFTQMTALKVHRKWHFRGDSKQNLVDGDATSSQTQINHPHLLGLQAVGLMPNMRSNTKTQKRKRELKCEYCPSTFISNNNLRRHIYELHKDEIGNLPEPPVINTDPLLQCRRCDLKFATKHEWIEHKVADARVTKPFGPFQWGCDLCGAYVSRKEKLINHIYNHMKEKDIVPVAQVKQKKPTKIENSMMEVDDDGDDDDRDKNETQYDNDQDIDSNDHDAYQNEETVQDDYEEDDATDLVEDNEEYEDGDDDGDGDGEVDEDGDDAEHDEVEEDADEVEEEEDYEGLSNMEMVMNVNENANDGQHDEEDDDDEDDEEDEDEEEDEDVIDSNSEDTNGSKIEAETSQMNTKTNIQMSADTSEAEDSPSYVGDDDDEDEEEDDEEEEEEEEDGETVSSMEQNKPNFSCDLCQVFFESQQELQKHVKMHFLNGPGSVTLSKSVNKSRSSSSDVVAVSSS